MAKSNLNENFRRFAHWTSDVTGSPWTFMGAVGVIAAWAVTGPIFHYSDTWQLVINTGTTIVTFLMVFLIQNTQNRDAQAIHLKLDELIRAVEGARNNLVDLENMSDEELAVLRAQFERLRQHAAVSSVAMLERQIDELEHEGEEVSQEAKDDLGHAREDMTRVREHLDRLRQRHKRPPQG
jgi:low affinity Fe/Cu permease